MLGIEFRFVLSILTRRRAAGLYYPFTDTSVKLGPTSSTYQDPESSQKPTHSSPFSSSSADDPGSDPSSRRRVLSAKLSKAAPCVCCRGPTAGPPPRAAAGCGVGRGALAGAVAFAFLLCGPCRAVREAVRVRLVRRIGHMQRHAVALVRAHREDLTCQCQGGALAPHRALCAEGWQEPHLAPSSTGRSSASFSSCTRCTSSAILPPSHGNMYSLGTITGNPGGHSKGGGVGARCRGPGVRRA